MKTLFTTLSVVMNIILSAIIGFVAGVFSAIVLQGYIEDKMEQSKTKKVRHEDSKKKKKESVGFDISNLTKEMPR